MRIWAVWPGPRRSAVGVTKAVGAWRSLGLITPSPPDKPPVYLCIFGLQPPTPLMRRCWRGNRSVQVAGMRIWAACGCRLRTGRSPVGWAPPARRAAGSRRGAGRARSRRRQRLAGRRESPEQGAVQRRCPRPGRSAAPDPEAELGRPPPPQAAFPEPISAPVKRGPWAPPTPRRAQTWT